MRRKPDARVNRVIECAVTDDSADRYIARIAGRQHGVVSRAQLLPAGIAGSAIDRRLRAGRLHPAHRGSISSTLLDLAAVLSAAELERAFAEAQVRRLVDTRGIADQLAGNPRRAGVRALRALIDAGPAPTRNDAERRLLRLLRAAELPIPA